MKRQASLPNDTNKEIMDFLLDPHQEHSNSYNNFLLTELSSKNISEKFVPDQSIEEHQSNSSKGTSKFPSPNTRKSNQRLYTELDTIKEASFDEAVLEIKERMNTDYITHDFSDIMHEKPCFLPSYPNETEPPPEPPDKTLQIKKKKPKFKFSKPLGDFCNTLDSLESNLSLKRMEPSKSVEEIRESLFMPKYLSQRRQSYMVQEHNKSKFPFKTYLSDDEKEKEKNNSHSRRKKSTLYSTRKKSRQHDTAIQVMRPSLRIIKV